MLIEVGLAQGLDADIDCRGWVAGCMGCIPAKALGEVVANVFGEGLRAAKAGRV